MKIIKYIGMGTALFLATGCTSGFEEYNTNPYRPPVVPANTLLSTMFQVYASPQQNSCQMNNTMWACFSGQVTTPTTWNSGDQAFAYYNTIERFNQATWNDFYGKIYTNLFQIEKLTEKKGLIYHIAQVTRVFAMSRIASLQGPLPYTQVQAGNTSAPYDDEKTAWHAMFDDLNAAIKVLEEAAPLGVNVDLASVDQFYKGDCKRWLKFANTLKLRMAIRISGAAGEADYAQQQAEAAVRSGVMDNVNDSSWDWTNSNMGVNGYNVVDSWGEVKANACLVSYMNGYNDPRREKYFTQRKDGSYMGVRSGSQNIPTPSTYADYSRLLIATNKAAPQPVMYAAEAAFLCAEGILKGWFRDLGMTDAKEYYEKGIRLSFEEYKVNGADDYINNDKLKPGNHDDDVNKNDNYTNKSQVTIKWNNSDTPEVKLEKVLTQKWIALFLDPMNGWADYRRTGYPQIFPATRSANNTCTIERGQRRLHFAESEYRTNKENTEAAVSLIHGGQDTNGADLWWALKN
ncbi:SusD/RagB family nutrient-binding outer membrane lipoprotein [Phocaeicola plebeius]|jgi:hypothetical protein|uniref:SusD/RagB family nutrient-binding outer membrane lipoprotein n=1 Tax=Phocaeicola plebeius TaxID=310297 RepID=A0A414WQB5_9BACT|nr:SusD/RagB family nutrient-binding outer membrane lipoprotein [Phocaeicola plebeius]RHH39034.1 SusD/RagB family nutrient-binding outer membrane lipoprotein [Phocaeicola plebeius]